jgi:hypothetical protein
MKGAVKLRRATTADLNKSMMVRGKMTPEAEKAYRESLEASEKDYEELVEELKSSRTLSKKDFDIRINNVG